MYTADLGKQGSNEHFRVYLENLIKKSHFWTYSNKNVALLEKIRMRKYIQVYMKSDEKVSMISIYYIQHYIFHKDKS